MRNTERELIIENALRNYNAAKQTENAEKIARAINDMENVFICVSCFQVKGTEKLRQTILKAKYK
jgi:hypothetical protein